MRGKIKAASTAFFDVAPEGQTSRQRPGTFVPIDPNFFNQTWNYNSTQTSLLSRPSPCAFGCFQNCRRHRNEPVLRVETTEPKNIPKEDFRRRFQQWKDRQAKRVQARGTYFEEDEGPNSVRDSKHFFFLGQGSDTFRTGLVLPAKGFF